MQSTSLTVTASDGTPVHVFRWLPDEGVAPKGVVQIAHGMAEHAARYAERLGRYCLQAPRQWFNFYPFWKNDDDASA